MPRQICPTCQRPPKVCYCSALVHIANRIKVLIIQHPLEQKHPFNTGRMVHLCLDNSELVVAESLSEAELARLLATRSALLYPSLEWLSVVEQVEAGTPQARALEQLVVIDASWRKSKKMLHLHPVLQRLPRVSFEGALQSNYQIRHSSLANSLSTLESIVAAMQQLEPERDFGVMLRPFERMVALQKASAVGCDERSESHQGLNPVCSESSPQPKEVRPMTVEVNTARLGLINASIHRPE